jgi:hypothetical protein
MAQGDTVSANNEDEQCVLHLMKEVQVITSQVPGSAHARAHMQNEICSLMCKCGLPNFYVTINPADVYNPLVKFLTGAEIDIDKLLPEEVPKFYDQSILVAWNPAVAAKFFNIYMKAFIKCLLQFKGKRTDLHEGILGTVSAYYRCIKAQGRGALHCHMLISLEDGLNPNEIKDQVLQNDEQSFKEHLLQYLEDTISIHIPELPEVDISMPN